MTYLSKDQLDKYLNSLPGKSPPISPSSKSSNSSSFDNRTSQPTSPAGENKQYQNVRNDLIYPMQNMALNDNTEQISTSKAKTDSETRHSHDAFETSLHSNPRKTTKIASSTNINKPPPPPTATKPIHLSSPNTKPTSSVMNATRPSQDLGTNKVIPSLYNQSRCGYCNQPVSKGIMVSALGKKWHAGCFTCVKCGDRLDKVEFFEKDGKPYCGLDYHTLFNSRCDYCKEPIEGTSVQALGKHYHEGHFFCHACKTPFVEQQFMIHDGHAYCEKDYLEKFGHRCQGCGNYIKGSFVGALGGDWHKECFVCADCGKPFPSGTFHVRDNRPYCEQHAKTSSNNSNISDKNKCYVCKESLAGAKLIASAFGNNYHPQHFQCTSCQRPLSARVPGLWENDGHGNLICKQCVRTRG